MAHLAELIELISAIIIIAIQSLQKVESETLTVGVERIISQTQRNILPNASKVVT